MNYRSFADLAKCIRENAYKLPADIDLIVGIPRSGMLPASILALQLNKKFCDVSSYLSNTELLHGNTRKALNSQLAFPHDATHILLVDDSVASGRSMEKARALIAKDHLHKKITCASIYVEPSARKKIDLYFETVAQPRAFEWNVMHRQLLEECCLDIDGVLCHDPTPTENDDGKAYSIFLLNAKPLAVPTYTVGHLVTSRLEKYRLETESWLAAQGIKYHKLHMLDLPDAVTRRRLGSHGSFKADVYRSLSNTRLFIESEAEQAQLICERSGKPVLCFDTQTMFRPGLSYPSLVAKSQSMTKRVIKKAVGLLRQ